MAIVYWLIYNQYSEYDQKRESCTQDDNDKFLFRAHVLARKRTDINLVAESGGRALIRGVDFQSLHVTVAPAMFHTGYCHIRMSSILRSGSLPSRDGESEDGHGDQTRIVYIL